jgi:hypothetical protein
MRDRDEDKPFVCVRSGWLVQISPRNLRGWLSMGLWIAALVPLAIGYQKLAASQVEAGSAMAKGLPLVFLGMLALWAVAMIRWLMARSEIVELADVAEWKRRQRSRREDR